MTTRSHRTSLHLPSAEDTERLGRQLSVIVRPGETILLEGCIGAGKTHLARALIQARIGTGEDIPSPTFTLVQTYGEAGDEIWHADLYRLDGNSDIAELGLLDAFGRTICLVEWPDRLGQDAPTSALHVTFSQAGTGRNVTLSGDESWAGRLRNLTDQWHA